jgi:hypothetical protein
MRTNRFVAARACQDMLHEPNRIGGTQATDINHRFSEAIIEETVREAQRVIDRPLAEASLFDEIGFEPCQQVGARDLRLGWRRGLYHADVDQMLGKPKCELVRADILAILPR